MTAVNVYTMFGRKCLDENVRTTNPEQLNILAIPPNLSELDLLLNLN